MDMVCVKGDDSNHDFDNDPIKIIEENGWLKADNTTL
jgi:dipeptidase D